jgi:hypothetical protein
MAASQDLEVQLLTACEQGDLRIVRELVERQAVDPRNITERRGYRSINVGEVYVYGYTPLHYASL